MIRVESNDVIIENEIVVSNVTAKQKTTAAHDYVNGMHMYGITVYPLRGRFGNQMFQYAALQGLAQLTHHTPKFTCSSSLIESYPFIAANCVPPERLESHIVASENSITFNASLLCMYESWLVEQATRENQRHIVISGYLQSWKYFQNVSSILHKHFQFNAHVTHYATEYLLSMLDQYKQNNVNVTGDVTTIGVHVRRGDFLKPIIQKVGLLPASLDYFHTAMNYFRAEYCAGTHCVFIVASDDVTWCRDNLLAQDVIIIADHETAVTSLEPVSDVQRDMSLLRLVEHNIISTGTFSWWVGWFTPGQVVYYKNYMRKGSRQDQNFTAENFFMPHWIGIYSAYTSGATTREMRVLLAYFLSIFSVIYGK